MNSLTSSLQVSWDPLDHFIVSTSCDRTVKIHSSIRKGYPISYNAQLAGDIISGKHITLSKREYTIPSSIPEGTSTPIENVDNQSPPMDEEGKEMTKRHSMFCDENLSTFVRRQSWSPDGSLLLLSTGLYRDASLKTSIPTTYMYLRGSWSKPVIQIPSGSEASIGVRFNTKLFKLGEGGNTMMYWSTGSLLLFLSCWLVNISSSSSCTIETPYITLPYKMIFAIATISDVIVYDTISLNPIAIIKDMHYAPITDISWSSDGLRLVIASQDGYCSLVKFAGNACA